MAAVCLYTVFEPISLKAVELQGREVYQRTDEQLTKADDIKNSESSSSLSNDKTPDTISDTPTGKVNINTASLLQLMTIDGIGETKAQAIVDYREEHGRFTTIQEITSVKGIGEKTFEKIKDNICV
ncbi:MAG: helix-hairpin-helix domain-containing protein [Clostridia bacterium]|nr:helix-hairpin-helix domain-containing protein [Clostridia bacterium]